jgi:hypothetical protein
MGLIWDNVYSELDKYGVTVVGAKTTGVGVGGTVLGGGRFTCSWKNIGVRTSYFLTRIYISQQSVRFVGRQRRSV